VESGAEGLVGWYTGGPDEIKVKPIGILALHFPFTVAFVFFLAGARFGQLVRIGKTKIGWALGYSDLHLFIHGMEQY